MGSGLRWFVPALAVACAGLTLAGVAAPTDEHAHFQRFTPRDGLPAAVVNCGLQDRRGFLWFGTGDGLARFDGHSFRVFRPDPSEPESLRNAIVLALAEDRNGDLWIGTETGLEVWRRSTERFAHFPIPPGGTESDAVQSLRVAGDDLIWVGTRRHGLLRFDPRTATFSAVPFTLGPAGHAAEGWVRCLWLDERRQLWIGTENNGLTRYDPATDQVERFRPVPGDETSLSHDRVSAIVGAKDGRLWVATDAGLCRLDPARGHFERHALLAEGTAEASVRGATALVLAPDESIWVGTEDDGLVRYDPRRGHAVVHRRSRFATNTIVADAVRMLFVDRDGDLWAGHFPAGVSHFDRSAAAFQVFTTEFGQANTLSDDQVLAFWEDPGGDLWVGTDNGGLNHWDAGTGRWQSFEHARAEPGSLGGKAAVSLLRDRQGTLWIGTWDGGLNRFDPVSGTFRRYQARRDDPRALADNHVWQMAEDHAGTLWLATIGGGIDRRQPGREDFVHSRYDPANPHSLNDDTVCSVLVTRRNEVWVGTSRGLARFNRATQQWDRFQTGPGEPGTLNGYWVFDLLEDRDGMIWATTEGGGLNHLDPATGHVAVWRVQDGLPSDSLRGLLQDDRGVLWIGSNRGLVRFDPRTGRVRVFDESNGLPGSQFNPHARLRLHGGDFLFGTTQGFVRFDPKALVAPAPAPAVVLTRFEVFNQVIRPGRPDSPLSRSITETTRLEIPARSSVIGFEFAALSYRSAARTRYRIRLDGFDHDWRELGSEWRATFTNLDPGHYHLRVQAANGDGVWSESGASLALVIVPPWWRTWWFVAGGAIAVLGGAAGIGAAVSAHRQREAQRERELAHERERAAERARAAEALHVLNQELETRVTERTAQLATAVRELEAFSYSVSHDLRAPLRAVDGFSTMLLEESAGRLDETGRRHLTRIRAAGERMAQLIDALLGLSRVSRVELQRGPVDLTALAELVAEELRAAHPARPIEFRIERNVMADADGRLLQIVLTNLLGNAVKFSSKREVSRVEFGTTERGGRRAFYVRDNGAGFDMAYAHKLFAAFQRLHSEAEFPGTGIGLATVHRIIQRHGGELSAEAVPDQGATFYFTIA
jgi:ligand-binding sensor domain-containing protein/signal transduction histidine kinase